MRTISPFHQELRSAARWLPRGIIRRWTRWLLVHLPDVAPRLPPKVERQVRALPGSNASVRIIRSSEKSSASPVVLWVHGGGYVVGSAKRDDAFCARLAQRLSAVVVSVDYRLAPEYPFPAALDDCLAAWNLIQDEAEVLGVNPNCVILAGQSAGGGLAAALVQRLLDLRRALPLLQVLAYPMLDDRTALRALDGRQHRIWDQRSNALSWAWYLRDVPGSASVPEYAAAARRKELRGLPPAWIGVGTADLFFDEDTDYADRLQAAGVPVERVVVPGAFHAFDLLVPGAQVSRAFTESQIQAMERALGIGVSSLSAPCPPCPPTAACPPAAACPGA